MPPFFERPIDTSITSQVYLISGLPGQVINCNSASQYKELLAGLTKSSVIPNVHYNIILWTLGMKELLVNPARSSLYCDDALLYPAGGPLLGIFTHLLHQKQHNGHFAICTLRLIYLAHHWML